MEKLTTLEDDYLEESETEAIHIDHQCDNCGKWLPPFGLTNVTNNTYWPNANYVCGHCYMDFSRELNKLVEDLSKVALPNRINPVDIRKEKRRILNETLWATATDGTVSEEEKIIWGNYRAAVAAVDPDNFEGWPTPPE